LGVLGVGISFGGNSFWVGLGVGVWGIGVERSGIGGGGVGVSGISVGIVGGPAVTVAVDAVVVIMAIVGSTVEEEEFCWGF
jgi:hypothetical protein